MNYDELITRYLQNQTTPDEHRQLLAWVKSSSENKRHFETSVQAWHISGGAKRIDAEKAYKAFIAGQQVTGKVVAIHSKTRFLRRVMQVAAVAAIAFGTYVWLSPNAEVQQIQFANINSETQVVNLPDGSKVYLNAGARISYPANFESDVRQIALSGEAFFEVTRNEAKPFVVQTHQGSVRVLGTSFSVIDDSLNKQTQVIVETGKVRLSNTAQNEYVDLLSGQTGLYNGVSNSLTKTENADLNYASWHTGRLTFKNTVLKDVIATIQRHYKTSVVLQNENAANCKFTARFDHEPIENVLKMLELTFSVRVSKDTKGFVIDGDGC